jgi:hypothetical protein
MAVKIKQDEINPIPVEIIAQSILDIAESMKQIDNSRLKRSAIVALIHDRSGINKGTIEVVMNNLSALEQNYLKPR